MEQLIMLDITQFGGQSLPQIHITVFRSSILEYETFFYWIVSTAVDVSKNMAKN